MDDTDMLHLIEVSKMCLLQCFFSFFFLLSFKGKLTGDDQYRI